MKSVLVIRRRNLTDVWTVQGIAEGATEQQAHLNAVATAQEVIRADPQAICWLCHAKSQIALAGVMPILETEL